MSSTSYEPLGKNLATSEHTISSRAISYDNSHGHISTDEIPLVDYGPNSHHYLDPNASFAAARETRTCLSFLAWWMPELVASFFSLATFIAIVIVLRIYDGVALSALKLPKYLTLNGIIAALATLNRAFMIAPVGSAIMQEVWLVFASEGQKTTPASRLLDLELFDSASRGAFGSFLLVLQTKGHRLLACVGALITILSLAFGTFTQQLVQYNRVVPIAEGSPLNPGNIPRTETLSRWFVGNPAEGASSPPYDAVAAFYQGVLTGGLSAISAECPAGNCTWPLTPSLAVCGGCQTSEKTPEPKCFDSCEQPILTNGETMPANCTVYKDTMCNYTMPSGNVMTLANWANATAVEYVSFGAPGFRSMSGRGAYYDASNATTMDRMYFANFDLFGLAYDSYMTDHNNTMAHSECALWFCVQTYNVSIEQGRQSTSVASTVESFNSSSYVFDLLPDYEGEFYVDNIGVDVLGMWAGESLNGVVTLNLEAQAFSSDMMKGVWNGTQDPQVWIQNLALSMTNVVRQANQTNRPESDGVGYDLGVSVRWPWIALPAALVFASLALLAVVMIRTAMSTVAPWKGSPLTLLLFDISPETKAATYGQAREYRGFQRAVGNRTVRLREEPGRSWTFQAT